jgi:hypothetical protein
MEPTYFDAVQNLTNNKALHGKTDGGIEKIVFPEGVTPPLDADVKTKLAELLAEYNTQDYARERAIAYPSTGDQLDMMYKDTKNSTTTHATAVEAVKTKWPKDNSGPVE